MDRKKILGILPARGGSKGLPGKNLRKIHGISLIGWSAKALLDCEQIDKSICSTDDETIAILAKESGLEVPFIRPDSLAEDTSMVVDVICHALDYLDDSDEPYTHVMLVQATTPTVTSNDLYSAIKLLDDTNADTVISGFRTTTQHPALMFTCQGNGSSVDWLLKNDSHSKRRQDFKDVFVRTGLFYLISTDVLRSKKSLYGDNIHAVIIDQSRAVTIDEEEDFVLAEKILEL